MFRVHLKVRAVFVTEWYLKSFLDIYVSIVNFFRTTPAPPQTTDALWWALVTYTYMVLYTPLNQKRPLAAMLNCDNVASSEVDPTMEGWGGGVGDGLEIDTWRLPLLFSSGHVTLHLAVLVGR